MGFFDFLKKKECSICGGEIGLLGNRKLEDGNMCKTCASKLSPWFSDRRNSTVEEINQQLAYREANKEKVAAFNTTRTLGEDTKVFLDENAGTFLVTSARNLVEANPDVLLFTDVTGCNLDIDESRREEKRQGKDGQMESYNPPRYTYYYNFYIVIQVRNPYFDQIRFRLNSSGIEIEDWVASRTPVNGGVTRAGLGMVLGRVLSGPFNPENDVEYRRYKEMGEEIKAALLQVRQQARDEAAAAAAPKRAITCPYCGATTTPSPSGCCEYCGGSVND